MRVLRALIAQKPPDAAWAQSVASAPRAKMNRASPILSVRQASPRAWLEVRSGTGWRNWARAACVHREEAGAMLK